MDDLRFRQSDHETLIRKINNKSLFKHSITNIILPARCLIDETFSGCAMNPFIAFAFDTSQGQILKLWLTVQ